MGSIYKRKWKDPKTGEVKEGEVWWIKYYRHGRPYRESSNSDKIGKAKDLLKEREGEISQGKLPGIHFAKVTFDELAGDYLTDYRVNGKKTLKRAEQFVEALKKTFEGMRAMDITTANVKAYIEKRMEEGLTNGTINRELAALKRMFNLGAECTPSKVNMIPHIPMLKESNVRKGFFEYGEYLALRDTLPSQLRPIVTFAYHSGWRKSEILGLTWDRVDLNEGVVRLNPGETKNDSGRMLYLDEEMMKEMKALFSQRQIGCPYVFHREGNRIKDFRGAWDTACVKAGFFDVLKDEQGNTVVTRDKEGNEKTVKVPNRIFHDFRRTAVRDMVRSGIPERVAMSLSGHKTRSVFERYNIVSDGDLREAARKRQVYLEKQNGQSEKVEEKRGEVIQFQQAQNE
jgi:integrase